jgi:tetratricopeptide (TPR) repeat protein
MFNRSLMEGGEAFREVRVNIAAAYEIKGDPAKALEHYLKAIEANNIDVGGRYERTAREGLERIRAHYAAFLGDLRTRAREQPGDFDAQVKTAFLLQTLGYYSEAEVFYRAAMDVRPDRWEMWYNLALTQMRRKQFADAVSSFEKALMLNPGDTNTLNNMGISFMHLKNYRRAEQSYRRALAQDPRFFYAVFNLGRLYFVTGDAVRAREQFDMARAMAGQDPALQGRIDQYLDQLGKG